MLQNQFPMNIAQAQVNGANQFAGSFPSQLPDISGLNGMASLPQYMAHAFQNAYALNTHMMMTQQNWNNTQVIQNAPVGSPEDVEVIIKAIRISWVNGKSTREALEGLHGVNNHPASAWKDYYLEHDRSIVTRISVPESSGSSLASSSKQPKATSSRDSVDGVHVTISSSLRSKNINPPTSHPLPTPSTSNTPRVRSAASQRSYKDETTSSRPSSPNSCSSAHCPTPPPFDPRAALSGGRMAFTEADKVFYFKYIKWQVKQDPNVSRSKIATGLAEKAPHHSWQSWRSYFQQHRHAVDRILKPQRDTKRDQSSADDDSNSDEQDRSKYSSSEGSEESEEGEKELGDLEEFPDTDQDIRDMGDTGGPYTAADFRIAARFIAAKPDWEDLKFSEKWEPFHMKYPQRTAKAWAHFVMRNERTIRKLMQIYRQRPRRVFSVATGPRVERVNTSAPKRRHESENSHDGSRASKRIAVERNEEDLGVKVDLASPRLTGRRSSDIK
ncbi:hypothetical protein SCP_0109140 [Sparassis crispa]|uniref:Uncharacterized protein n=1 Tax=Sparassis crispa TaxID=139825 RepID=A0A401G790_9APHY|nr:hypothetical protein SCP_0109140 [Sparassis crispa]GBE78032.1 hypothetical protein SCP_0109140 [Sparassis crispa]